MFKKIMFLNLMSLSFFGCSQSNKMNCPNVVIVKEALRTLTICSDKSESSSRGNTSNPSPITSAIGYFLIDKVYASTNEIPECNKTNDGKLIYIQGDNQFKTCSSNTWSLIDLTGPQGPQGIQGVQGTTGPQGSTGATGATGSQGPTGSTGANGTNGTNGTNGSNGVDGKSVRNGSGAPSNGAGVDGDFYIDTSNNRLYGPKASGSWGSYTNLVGPTGATGATGSVGATGATGAQGIAGTTTVKFTRTEVDIAASDSTKDTQCQSEYGSNYEAAHRLEMPLYAPYTDKEVTFASYTSNAMYMYDNGTIRTITFGASSGNRTVMCIRKDSPFRITRTTIASTSSDSTKDALCVSSFSSSYIAAHKYEIGNFHSGSVIGNVNVGGDTNMYRLTQSSGVMTINSAGTGTESLLCSRL